MKNYLVVWLAICSAICAGQAITGTDLRLKKAGTAAGKYSFRFDSALGTNGALIGIDASGAETSRWDAETGMFTGSSGGGVAWGSITGTLSNQTDLQAELDDKPSLTNGGQFMPGASTWFSGSDTLYTNFVNFGSPGSSFYLRRQGLALQIDPQFLAVTASDATVIANKFQGSGDLLTDLDADNISAGTLPISHGGTGLTALGTAGQVMRVNSGATGLEWYTPSSGVAWGSITGTLSDQTDLQNELDDKEDSISAGTTGQYWRGDKSWQTLNKAAVGLGNVDNTSDMSKPVSTAMTTALSGKANTSHNHNASNITAGTLVVARGGTGLSTLGSANQVLRVNSGGTALEYATISTGGVWGSITGTLSDQTDLQSALNASGRLTGGNSWIGNQTFSSGYVYVDQNFGVGGDMEVDGVSNFYDDVNIDQSLAVEGSVTATSFIGSGASLTNLNAGNISAGTLPIARGGTGLTALGASGEVLAVNGAGTGLEFVPMSGGGGGTWGSITGTLSSQTDLQTALNNKQSLNSKLTALGNFSAVGIMVHRGGGEYVARGISGGSGIIVSPSTADGVDGNPMIMLDSTVLRTNTAQIITGVKTFQNASGFLVKTSGASPGWTLMDRSTIPGRQFVFQSNTAETGANKYMVLNFWVAGSTKAAPAVNNMNYYWESDPAADPNNGRAGVFGLDITNERFVIATRNFGANYLTNASLPIEFAAGDNVGGSTQLRLQYSGGANRIGFFGATPVVRQTATDLPGVIAALKAYGLLTP